MMFVLFQGLARGFCMTSDIPEGYDEDFPNRVSPVREAAERIDWSGIELSVRIQTTTRHSPTSNKPSSRHSQVHRFHSMPKFFLITALWNLSKLIILLLTAWPMNSIRPLGSNSLDLRFIYAMHNSYELLVGQCGCTVLGRVALVPAITGQLLSCDRWPSDISSWRARVYPDGVWYVQRRGGGGVDLNPRAVGYVHNTCDCIYPPIPPWRDKRLCKNITTRIAHACWIPGNRFLTGKAYLAIIASNEIPVYNLPSLHFTMLPDWIPGVLLLLHPTFLDCFQGANSWTVFNLIHGLFSILIHGLFSILILGLFSILILGLFSILILGAVLPT